jgi:hypothetical protein
MHRFHLQPVPKDLELAVVTLSSEEHERFHRDATQFVNDNNLFPKRVSKVEVLQHAPSGGDWLSIIVHYPHCSCAAACIPTKG